MWRRDQAVFFLNRYIRDLEDKGAGFDHIEAAEKGMPYNVRKEKLTQSEKLKAEYEALLWAKEQLQALKEFGDE